MRRITLISVFAFGCSSSSKSDSGTQDSAAWWLTDTAQGSDTDNEDDDEEDFFEAGTSYYGVIPTDDWSMGMFYYEYVSEAGQGCFIEGELTNITVPNNCSECVLDVTATISGLAVAEDLGDCSDSDTIIAEFEGLEVAYGQGQEVIDVEDQLEFFELFEEKDGSWASVPEGMTVVGYEEEFGQELWAFAMFL